MDLEAKLSGTRLSVLELPRLRYPSAQIPTRFVLLRKLSSFAQVNLYRLLRVFQLDSAKGQLLMHGHLKLTGKVCRGVITVANDETNVTPVRAYKRRCGTVGPCPDNEKCGLCGHTVPTAGGVKAPHECTPFCAVCGQAHATNSRDCTVKFRQLKLPGHKAKIQNLESRLAPAAPSPQNSDAMESDAELSPALVAILSAMEERLTSKLGSMNETAMDQILTKVMTAVPAMISKHIMDSPRLLARLGPVKDHNSAHNTIASLPVGTARDEAAGDLVNGASQACVLPTAGLELASTPDQEGGDQAAAASTACGPGLLTAASWELPRGPTSDAAPVPGVAKKAIANVATAGPSVDDAAAVNGHSNL
ncbi:hypothetical protein HPB49_013018 [Dermacentor silvarum]|uniref:Uncharacterized protein n=1 Tax=Dermacentor silvarum TaxID=543639 RepID=A0ACB8E084_DERSI|nr:hypothetical protein HPB49_013018 [Dermacentor silvarum]